VLLGEWPTTIGHPWYYFTVRGCVLDCRGPLTIHPDTMWGYGVKVLTMSHDTSQGPGRIGVITERGVTVDEGAWIGSYALLCGCHIGAGAVVAAGTVVRGQDVAPGVMVAGNPARVVAHWAGERWRYLPEALSGFARVLV
jgi:acetyltransferase-like isoleucine patch superfamily enzyme